MYGELLLRFCLSSKFRSEFFLLSSLGTDVHFSAVIFPCAPQA